MQCSGDRSNIFFVRAYVLCCVLCYVVLIFTEVLNNNQHIFITKFHNACEKKIKMKPHEKKTKKEKKNPKQNSTEITSKTIEMWMNLSHSSDIQIEWLVRIVKTFNASHRRSSKKNIANKWSFNFLFWLYVVLFSFLFTFFFYAVVVTVVVVVVVWLCVYKF